GDPPKHPPNPPSPSQPPNPPLTPPSPSPSPSPTPVDPGGGGNSRPTPHPGQGRVNRGPPAPPPPPHKCGSGAGAAAEAGQDGDPPAPRRLPPPPPPAPAPPRPSPRRPPGRCGLNRAPPPPRAGGSRWAAGGARCGLRSLAVRVGELGLGYPSQETVLFRYCGGGCPAPPTNHGLVLARLRPGGAAGGAGPCCRPSRYEDVAFLDERQRWHRLHQLSAAACRCVG
ncbi:persephin, partial [Grus americana]|uniref:persephin n=1 Tax=Grus americana TaxID=9117 RepID=UPI002407872C